MYFIKNLVMSRAVVLQFKASWDNGSISACDWDNGIGAVCCLFDKLWMT